ncbi:hypothetical protein [Gloeocapsa sp. PCC 73106]|uniref:hypothetical protein n=1 Tax=Gloeocapsa sp. PCC 73106 TaxID=102232 RepID=UPI0002ACC0D0|nr:hypothetical protein [Gloeocapsa sp. PCC 73106]ELR97424.1 hypothetical protein GLO73106DRAFT_00012340 [Gloeocapsa sp. PCC 73106]
MGFSSINDPTPSQIILQVSKARETRTEFLEQMRQRQQQGWKVAQDCARILKEQFGVKRVVLFGSYHVRLITYNKSDECKP